jgi:putative acetyltransferase
VHFLAAVADGEVIGILGLEAYVAVPRCAHAGAVALSVAQDWHGKGVASKLMAAGLDLADNWLNLKRLELEVFVDNTPALRLYERFGFEREGTKRMLAYRNGRYVDPHIMARLRP